MQNSRKHSLNVEVDFESSDAYAFLKSLLAEEGYSPFVAADIINSLLNYRRVMDAYYETYTQPKEVDESIWNMSLAGVRIGLGRMSAGSSVTDHRITKYDHAVCTLAA